MTGTPAKLEELAKRRGFFFSSSEIYGGISGLYDYGHLGTMVKRKWENVWRTYFLGLSDKFYEIDACNIMHESVFKASGHIDSFIDPVVRCRKCGTAERADHLIEENLKESFEGASLEQLQEIITKHRIKCRKCGGILEEVGVLNMMFPLSIGSSTAYLRPETAQGVYVNFLREYECLRRPMPFGLAIIGKAFRNEISPRNSLLRMREFTQAELQIFFDPNKIGEHEKFDDSYGLHVLQHGKKSIEIIATGKLAERIPKFYVYHMEAVQKFYLDVLKIDPEKFRFRELSEEERAFYNKYHWDVEAYMGEEIGWKEIGGVHYRTDHDLGGHQKISKKDMSISADGKKIIPHVLELSFGVDRNVYGLMLLGLEEEKERTIIKFPRLVSPYDCALFPLVNRDGMEEKSLEIMKSLKNIRIFHDSSGSIGRRYRRADEVGIPVCVTVDSQTMSDGTVTMRDRDTMQQVRVNAEDLEEEIMKFLNK